MKIEQIENYRIVEKVGEGGMAEVYKAVDINSKKTVSIKTLKENINTKDESYLRFKQEAKLLAGLNHIGILKFIDVLEKDQRIYIVTEFLSGQNLKECINEKYSEFSIDNKIDIIRQIAEALDYVHSQGIIHRDIKPSNIMVMHDNQIKILDFGVANLTSYQELFSKQISMAGSFLYMSPEQSGILKRSVDHRTDIYSLGILFYELICNKPPYFAEEIGELLHQHIAKIPDDPIHLIPDLPPVINSIILKLIKKDPDERYQTAYGLAEDLKIYLKLKPEDKKSFIFELGKKDKIKNLNYRTRLVGRKNELKQLTDPINNTAFGNGFVSLVIGKSGTGKTRLISEIQKYTASTNALYVNILSSEADINNPYYPFCESIKSILQYFQTKVPEKRQQEIYETLTKGLGNEGKVLTTIVQELIPIIGKYDTNTKFDKDNGNLFFEKLRDFFFLIASPANPIVLCFDNINFWDQGSLQFFLYFNEFIQNKSIYIILSISEEKIIKNRSLYETLLTKSKAGKAGIVYINNFNLEETSDLITEIFGTIYSGMETLTKRLFEATQGNALLIIENIKTIVEEEIIFQESEGWNINFEKLKNYSFSTNIIDKIIVRLSKMDKSTKDILNYAAIIRNNFSLNLLLCFIEKFNKNMKNDMLLALINNAIKAQMLTEILSDKGEINYFFTHEKIIEILLADKTEKEIKILHKACAEIIEKEYNKDDKIFRLAFHYLAADSRNNAYNCNIEAGKKALNNFSFKQAVKFYYNALDIIRNFGAKSEKALASRISLSLDIIDLNLQLGEHDENIHLLEEIKPFAESLKNKNNIVKILFLLGRNFSFIGNNHLAMEYYKKALPLAEELKLTDILAVIYSSIGRAHVYSAEYNLAIDNLKKGIQMFPSEDSLEKLYPLGMLGQSYCYLGLKKEALAIVTELSSYKYANNEMMKIWSSFYIAVIMAYVGDPNKAIDECEKVHEMAREDKIIVLELNSLLILARAQYYAGNYKDSIKNLLRYIKLSIQHHLVFLIYLGYLFLSECYIVTGNISAARNCLNEALEKYTSNLNIDFINQWAMRLNALFEVFSHTPDFDKALENIDEAIKHSEVFGEAGKYMTSQNYAVKFYILFKMEKENEAEQYFEKAITFFKEKDLQNDIVLIRKIRTKLQSKKEMSEIHVSSHEADITSTFTDSITTTAFSYQRQLKYLIKLSEQLSRYHEMDGLLKKIMELAIEASGAERGCLFLCSESSCEMKIKSSISGTDNTETFFYSQSTLDKTLETEKGQLILDAEKELADDASVAEFQLKSIITVPLITQGKLLGAVYLDNKHVKGLFNEENFELLKAFAIEAAISIENAKLYEQVKENAKTEQELAIAQDIQVSILPTELDVKGYSIASFMRTAAEVGGDYFDFYLKDEPYFGVFGDVSGHGLKSGLIMLMAEVSFNTLVRAEILKNQGLPEIYQTINNTLYENIQKRLSQKSFIGSQYSNMYMTFRIFRFDAKGNFEMFGNDHAEPFIVNSETGKITAINSSGFIIGILQDALADNVNPFHFQLKADDILVLYSDGITEAKLKNSERKTGEREVPLYGEERLYECVLKNKNKTPDEIIKSVIAEVDGWMDEQFDDITMVVIKKT